MTSVEFMTLTDLVESKSISCWSHCGNLEQVLSKATLYWMLWGELYNPGGDTGHTYDDRVRSHEWCTVIAKQLQ